MMKKILASAFVFALFVSISASALAVPAVKDAPVQIVTSVSMKEFKMPDGQVLMTVHTEIPVLSGGPSEAATQSVNAYYQTVAKEYVASLVIRYLQDSIGESDRLKELGMNYSFHKGFQVAYNANGLLSIFFENSYDLMGAHRTSTFKGETIDLQTGKKLALGDILPDVPAEATKDNATENSIRQALPELLDQNVSLRDISAYTYTLSNVTNRKATLTIYLAQTAGDKRQLIIPLKKEDGEWRMGTME